MNNFEAIKTNLIPSNIFNSLLNVYKRIGSNKYIIEKLEDDIDFLKEKNLDVETICLTKYLKLNVTDNRLRLLLNKGSAPLNKEEKTVLNIREVLNQINTEASDLPFNGSEILQYLNKIFGKNTHKFTTRIYNELLITDFDPKKTSIRAMTEKIIDDYYKEIRSKSYEKLYLSLITYLQLDIMMPYDDHNELATMLALYYMVLSVGIETFKYVSFFDLFLSNLTSWNETKKLCYVNYPNTPLKVNALMPKLLSYIEQSYQKIDEIIVSKTYEKRMFKSDGIEQTIYQMPNTFTKEDIRRYHPNVSDSTLNRALFKLRDEKIIMPLGKGRSARWIKLISDDDPRNIFGGHYNGNQD